MGRYKELLSEVKHALLIKLERNVNFLLKEKGKQK